MMEQQFEMVAVKTEPEQLQGFAAQVQSLDPERDVVELAFENIHDRVQYLGPISQPYQFISDLLTARTESRDNHEQRLCELEVIERQLLDRAARMRQEASADENAVARQSDMWLETVSEHRQAVMASIERRTKPDSFGLINCFRT